ncbi:MAG: SIMPL domain-containing protein [Armatimonadota bacterium]|nr:SIMPL domain-containing protein [Armatimonadota bacterium]
MLHELSHVIMLRRDNRIFSILSLITTAALLYICATPAQCQDTSGPRGITVSGQGEVFAAPDIARINIGVATRNKDAKKAAEENAAKAQRIIQALQNAGIAKKDIQTTQYSVEAMFDYKVQPPRLTGYQVSNMVRVVVRDIKKTGDIIDRSIAAGANSIQGVSFEVENDTQLRNDALIKAIQEAKAKASLIAQTLSVRLGGLIAVNESVGGPIYPIAYARVAAAEAAPTPILPGEVRVTASVSLTYDIAR